MSAVTPNSTSDLLEEIWERNELADRVDDNVSAVVVLLSDATKALDFAWADAHRQCAVTPETLAIMKKAALMVNDAVVFADNADQEPQNGTVELTANGCLIWRPRRIKN